VRGAFNLGLIITDIRFLICEKRLEVGFGPRPWLKRKGGNLNAEEMIGEGISLFLIVGALTPPTPPPGISSPGPRMKRMVLGG